MRCSAWAVDVPLTDLESVPEWANATLKHLQLGALRS